MVGLGVTEAVAVTDREEVSEDERDTDDDGDGTMDGDAVDDCEIDGVGSLIAVITAVDGGTGTQGNMGAVPWPHTSVDV
jgi:hypothetical protein